MATPHRFNPKNLARSVIALPLQEKIDEELRITDLVEKSHPHIRETHNAAIFLQKDYPGGAFAALAVVRQLLEQVTSGSMSTVDNPDPTISDHVALALLEGGVGRQLLGLDGMNPLSAIDRIWPSRIEVIIDLNLSFVPVESIAARSNFKHPDPRRFAKALVREYVALAIKEAGGNDPEQRVHDYKTELSSQYVFANLDGRIIKALVNIDQRKAMDYLAEAEASRASKAPQTEVVPGPHKEPPPLDVSLFRAIHHIWPDFELRSCIINSISTVKVDAAHRSFAALGDSITWGVIDSGIDALHPHFKLHGNIDPASPDHADFTSAAAGLQPLKDDFGHGTHVAGIIAGQQSIDAHSDPNTMVAAWSELDDNGKKVSQSASLDTISGMASKCRLVSLKVLDEFGIGKASNVIAAISHVQLLNGHGRDFKIHGVNLSLGHPFDPKWFACGHSPLCVEVNRLVKSGVVVVVAAGNTGYGTLQTKEGASDACLELTINDPGNAECAITVGSTHRDMPHMYGVSYFSSKGPTGDGRRKPDLLAPGEKIISCAAANSKLAQREASGVACNYFETSGTSMAAPHVSGAIAAFLSIRKEFIGEAEKVKQIFTASATDLGRDHYFQGAGLVDLMRAIQSV